MRPGPALRAAPDWATAAQLLIDGCAHAPDTGYRIELIERLCLALGDQLYPAFLNVLCLVGDRGTPAAQSAVAEALVDALRNGRLPTGRRAAWGASTRPGASPGAALGPLEYLCAWFAEPHGVDAPSAARFDRSLVALLRLVSQSPRAQDLYVARLRALAQDPLDGTLSRRARQALVALADHWSAGGPDGAADAVLQALGGGGLRSLSSLATPLAR